MSDITAMIGNPSDFGFKFLTETVKRGGKTSGPIQILQVENVGLFEKAFPGLLKATANRQSIRVNSQRVARTSWFDHGEKDAKSQQVRLLNWALRLETSETKYGPGPEDEYYETPEELKDAWMAF